MYLEMPGKIFEERYVSIDMCCSCNTLHFLLLFHLGVSHFETTFKMKTNSKNSK